MHFFYLDETGCTGADLKNVEQPIFVVGGVDVADEKWLGTQSAIREACMNFFGGKLPENFELHASELVNGEGFFADKGRENRNALAHSLLDVIAKRGHSVHFVGIDKAKLAASAPAEHLVIDCRIPYQLGFNYLVTYIERYVRERLGVSARGMIILDKKDIYQSQIDRLTHYRRYEVPSVRKLKRIVEFSYPIDSVRHSMIQLSDLVIFLTRKFLECENGYRPNWPVEAKNFFAACYAKIIDRTKWSGLIDCEGQEEAGAATTLTACHSTHRPQWRSYYQI
ncbi:DUF3800 domain-containing protein [Bradyrhizobium sp. SZCCHNS3053]|uniref:DUF3800 domain-containing protein n=1 Tax=Bradyrhizobium sp. SZCCHNS3053 TaxID=3057322 RepID=UPI002916D27A|nr:DUF3800 domain-containing protein [Bradyrhizobium sp. SZCCHNS3053]